MEPQKKKCGAEKTKKAEENTLPLPLPHLLTCLNVSREAERAQAQGSILQTGGQSGSFNNGIVSAHIHRAQRLVGLHELVHVLSDDGEHSNEPGNLMRAHTSRRNTRLTDAQCSRLRSRGEANGLLTRSEN